MVSREEALEFELDFAAACTMMAKPGTTYEEARKQAVKEHKEEQEWLKKSDTSRTT